MAEEIEEAEKSPEDGEVRYEAIDLHSGEALTLSESRRIAASTRVQLILLVGAVASGKTSLIAGLFHMFQRGPIGDYFFAGSESLVGFERRCHDARIDSKRRRPTAERTKLTEERTLLHLKVAHREQLLNHRNLMFVDVSGELFEDAVNAVDECKKVPFIKRADHFVLLVDGCKLADSAKRQKAKREATLALQSFCDAGLLGSKSIVEVVVTKYDLIVSDNVACEFVEGLESSLMNRFEERIGRLRFHRTAARPEPGSHNCEIGHGVVEAFREWVEDRSDLVFGIAEFRQNAVGSCQFETVNLRHGE